ncbi:MAG: hypothetical protein RIG77_11245 [Cyclobacteriaceae bacterium]
MSLSKWLPIWVLTLILHGCGPNGTIAPLTFDEANTLKVFTELGGQHTLVITSPEEQGEQLRLCLTLCNKANGRPLINQKVHFYHTSSTGKYEPSDSMDESSARLSGSAVTDNQGRIYVQTILPGSYGNSKNNRHIHTTVYGAKPEAYDIHFRQYTGFMGKNFIEGSDQHFLADLKTTDPGLLVTFLKIECKFRSN